MRSKVVLIKGFANISPYITLAPFERINADHVVVMAALRFPQFIPEGLYKFQMNLQKLHENVKSILNLWKQENHEHLIAAEYASIAIDHGGDDVRAVEGDSLTVKWFYDTIKNYHRHFGQTVIDCEVFEGYVEIDEKRLNIEEAIFRLSPPQLNRYSSY
jgi:hypothetical protein